MTVGALGITVGALKSPSARSNHRRRAQMTVGALGITVNALGITIGALGITVGALK